MIIDNVALYLQHDAGICFEYEDELYCFEMERITKKRYEQFIPMNNYNELLGKIILLRDTLMDYFDVKKITFNKLYFNCNQSIDRNSDVSFFLERFMKFFNIKVCEPFSHHLAHAACAYSQSGFDETLIFSIDGGGSDENFVLEFFCIYHASKNGIKKITEIPIDLGMIYTWASYIPVVTWTRRGTTILVGCGKFMGLSAYGSKNPSIIWKLKNSLLNNFWYDPISIYPDTNDKVKEFLRCMYETFAFEDFVNFRGTLPSESFRNHILNFKDCATFASNMQEMFVQVILEIIEPYIYDYDMPICVTGGVALNVLLNERIRQKYKKPVFVPSNPNDSGIPFGGWLLKNWDKYDKYDVVYKGWDILDRNDLNKYKKEYVNVNCSIEKLANEIVLGNIIGVVNGRSECGPRALGNRSILCDPSIPDMKDILNSKVKDREWYRPFAPVVRYEDRNKYFHFDGDSPYMSFATQVRASYHERLQAITHVDGSARIQTVKKEQNDFLYDLLTEMERMGKIPVLLNTSFNIKGNPILTTIKDALYVLDNTKLDAVYVEGILFTDRR